MEKLERFDRNGAGNIIGVDPGFEVATLAWVGGVVFCQRALGETIEVGVLVAP